MRLLFGCAGLMYAYVPLQLCIFMLVKALLLFWSVAFPFSYRRLIKDAGKMRTIHIATIAVASLTPIPFALVFLKDGFVNVNHPTLFCFGRNNDFVFYFNTLPLSILIGSFSVLWVLIFFLIIKVKKIQQ